MGVRSDVSQLAPLAMVEMFEWDDRVIGGTNVFRWHPGTTVEDEPIVWQGVTYEPFPIQTDGFEMSGVGKLPRPTARMSNIGGAIGAYLRTIQDGIGAKFTRKRTLGKYLDAVNFPAGNPYADPLTSFPDEIFYVTRKASENPIFIDIEMAVPFDVDGIQLPRRQVIAGTCQWIYRSPECGYAGPAVEDINGNPTTNMALDACRKSLTACKHRFGAQGTLRTSAFPASMLAKYS
jgi:lambda family phage minor tail protein L